MKLSNRYRIPFLAALLIVPTAMFGFAAANVVPKSAGGEASAAISGYTTSNVHYNLNAANPEQLDSVQFALAPLIPGTQDPTVVKAKVVTAASYANGVYDSNASVWVVTPTVTTMISETDFLSVIATQ